MQACLIVLILIAFDVLTGVTKALIKGDLNSHCLRTGLWRKTGEIFTVFGGLIFEYSNTALGLGINIPLASAIAGYIAIMEITSITENICEINPRMANIFKPYLLNLDQQEKGDDDEEKGN